MRSKGGKRSSGDAKAVQYLLNECAWVDYQMSKGESLLEASANGNVKVVKLLLEHNAKVDFQDTNGVSPLFIASQNGYVGVVKVLLEKGAQVDLLDSLLYWLLVSLVMLT